MSAGFVIREKGGPVPFGAKGGPKPHRPLHFTYPVKVVFGHHVTHTLEGDPGNSARIFPTKRTAEEQLRYLQRDRWIVISLKTARRDQAEVDAQNIELAEKRERWEAAVAGVAEAERYALAALRGDPLCHVSVAEVRLRAADQELAEALR